MKMAPFLPTPRDGDSMNRKWVLVGVTLAGLAAALAATGIGLARQKARAVSVPILMYHKVGDAQDSPWWVTTQAFETQLQGLREQGYESVLPSELVAHRRWGWPLPAKPVLLTFDDGYLAMLETAEPLLKRYGFRAVCYLITAKVSNSPETRQSWEGTPLLSWPEVRAMERRGTVVFGGHSQTHVNLRALTDPGDEIAGCFRDLKQKGGFKPEGFCYPYGQYREDTPERVRKAGFTTATTCDDGIAEVRRGVSLLTLPRVTVMGGNHRFSVSGVAAGGERMSVCVSKEGARLDVCPRLVWTGAAPGGAWLDPVSISSIPALLQWGPLSSLSRGAPVLELWDLSHVVRYFRFPLPAGGGG